MENEEGTEQLAIDWMDVLPAPEAVLDLLACSCSKKCTLPKCICVANGLNCTYMCKLLTCANRQSATETDDVYIAMEDINELYNDYDC